MSATPTTGDWYETNLPPPQDASADPRPQWVRSIAQRLEVRVPLDMHLTRSYNDDDSDSEATSASGTEDGGEQDMDADDIDSLPEDGSLDGEEYNRALEVAEVHPHRFRLHGLAISPGGGVTAVLASSHSTQHPERGGWHTIRSSILFGHRPRRRQRQREIDVPDAAAPRLHPEYAPLIDPHIMNMDRDLLRHSITDIDIRYARLTTEAKLFEYLYGGGPEVPGVHYPTMTGDVASSELRRIFAPALESQRCDLCGTRMGVARRGALSGCEQGHFFGTCATSGLAVQTPGATRSCGTCGLRTMRAETLIAKAPEERRADARRLVADGVCGACGGKFLS